MSWVGIMWGGRQAKRTIEDVVAHNGHMIALPFLPHFRLSRDDGLAYVLPELREDAARRYELR